jgi:hypothetical protein
MIVNGSWAQTNATLLEEILNVIKDESNKIDNIGDIIKSIEPVVNVAPAINNININVAPPVNNIIINMDDLVSAVNELKLEISKIKPVVIIEGKCFSKHELEKRKRPIRKCLVVHNKKVELGVDDWIIVPSGTLKTGYQNNIDYKIYGGYLRSNKLFWLIDGDKREVMIKRPKVYSKEYYDAAKKEAKFYLGVDL